MISRKSQLFSFNLQNLLLLLVLLKQEQPYNIKKFTLQMWIPLKYIKGYIKIYQFNSEIHGHESDIFYIAGNKLGHFM